MNVQSSLSGWAGTALLLLAQLSACGGGLGEPNAATPADAAVAADAGTGVDAGAGGGGNSAKDAAIDDEAASADASAICSRDGVCWRLPSPQGQTLNAVWAADQRSAFAVGERGTILRYRDGKVAGQQAPVDVDLFDIHGTASSDVWAVGEAATVLHFDGSSWDATGLSELVAGPAPAEDVVLYGIFALAPDDVWAVGHSGSAAAAVHFDGEGWTNHSPAMGSDGALRAVWGLASNEVWAVGDRGVIRFYDGASWNEVRSGVSRDLWSVHALVGHDVWVTGAAGTVLRWDGAGFSQVASGSNAGLTRVRVDVAIDQGDPDAEDGADPAASEPMADAGVGDTGLQAEIAKTYIAWIFADDGTVLRFDGESFASMPSATTQAHRGAARLSAADMVAVGQMGQWMRLTGDGHYMLSSGSRRNRLAMSHASDQLWIVGDEVLRQAGRGGFEVLNRPVARSLYGAWAAEGELWAVGTEGTVVRWADGFEQVDVPAAGTTLLRDIHRAGASLWIVGHGGLALLRAGGGFINVATPTREHLLSLWGDADERLWVVGEGGTVLRWDGSAFAQVPTPLSADNQQALRGVHGFDVDDVWIVGTESTILHWTGAGFEDHSRSAGYSLNAVWGDRPDRVFAVGTGGTLLRFDGESWSALQSGTERNLEAVVGDGAGRLWMAGVDGTVLELALD